MDSWPELVVNINMVLIILHDIFIIITAFFGYPTVP
jgi:hypothetical protein